jgi:hypothetical protein
VLYSEAVRSFIKLVTDTLGVFSHWTHCDGLLVALQVLLQSNSPGQQ